MDAIEHLEEVESKESSRVRELRSDLGLWTEEEYALLRGVTRRTLLEERAAKRGCDYVKLGRRVFYPRAAVADFIKLNIVQTDRAA